MPREPTLLHSNTRNHETQLPDKTVSNVFIVTHLSTRNIDIVIGSMTHVVVVGQVFGSEVLDSTTVEHMGTNLNCAQIKKEKLRLGETTIQHPADSFM